jgi:putative transposase
LRNTSDWGKIEGTRSWPLLVFAYSQNALFCVIFQVPHPPFHHLAGLYRNHLFPIASNLLEQDFTADASNKKWVTDFTCIDTREGHLFVAGILDTYSRKIVGWSMSDQHDAEFVQAALSMALLQRQPGAGLVHHSDRGSEYASISHQMMLSEHAIQGSMSKKGDCYDNAMIESFWATLKEECVEDIHFSTRKEAKAAIFAYIEVYYNRIRRHSSLSYVSPVEYEKQGERKKEQKERKA